MSLIGLVLTLVIVGVLLWLLNNYVPMDSKIKTIINGRHRGCHLAVAGVRCPGLVARRTRSVARARTGSEPPSVSRRTDKGRCRLPPK